MMKYIMMLKEKLVRSAVLVLAMVVAILSFAGVANAGSKVVSFNLGPGEFSKPITIPVVDQAVLIIGTQTAIGYRGVGQVSLLRTKVAPLFLEWVGLESPSAAAVTSGFSSATGQHIVYLDFSHQVDIQVASASQIQVFNGSAGDRTGYVKMIW